MPDGGAGDGKHGCKPVVPALGYVAATRKADEDGLMVVQRPLSSAKIIFRMVLNNSELKKMRCYYDAKHLGFALCDKN